MPSAHAPPLSLGGNLADFPLPDVLTFLNMGQVTGAIEVVGLSHANRIFLAGGEVVYATSRSPLWSLETVATARGLLTESMARELKARAARTGRPLAELLAEAGLLDGDERTALEKSLCAEIVFESMRWREGKFAFLKDRRPPEGAASLRISVQNLILEGARRIDEAARLEKEIHVDRDLVVTLVFSSGRLEEQVVLTPIEWGVVSLINGKRTLEEIFALSPAGSETETWMSLQRLVRARMIQLHPREAQGLPEPPAPSEAINATFLQASPAPLPPPSAAPSRSRADEITDRLDKTDVRLLVGGNATTSYGMFGRRVPARFVGALARGEAPAAFDLNRPVMTLGRSPSSDIVLPDVSVSKNHARISQDGEGWSLADLGSTNGTWVNGERVREARLAKGDLVRFGIFTLEFDALAPPPDRAD